MEGTWVLNNLLRMVFLGLFRTIKGSLFGSLKLRMSNLPEAMALQILDLTRGMAAAKSVPVKLRVVGENILVETSLTDAKHLMIAPTKLLGGTNLLGGTEIRPTRAELLGGTIPNEQAPKGVIKSEIAHPVRVTIKLPV